MLLGLLGVDEAEVVTGDALTEALRSKNSRRMSQRQ